MINVEIDVVVYNNDNEFNITKILEIDWQNSVKDIGSVCNIKIPKMDIIFEGDSISFGQYKISINDNIRMFAGYEDKTGYDIDNNAIPSPYFSGYVSNFTFTKTDITIEVSDSLYLMKKMNRVKFSKQNATMLDILESISLGYETSNNGNQFKITTDLGDIDIEYIDIEFDGNYIIKNPLSPYEILSMLVKDLGIQCYTIGSIILIGRPDSLNNNISFSYPYVEGSNFIIDVNIDQYTNDLSQYIIKGSCIKTSTEKTRVAYGLENNTPTFIEYNTFRDNTININYPHVKEETLKTLVKTAWDKLSADKQKNGSFLTFGIPSIGLNDSIILNLYGDISTYIVDGVSLNFSMNGGLRQEVMLGKKLS